MTYADLINYIHGHGDWDFGIQKKRGLKRGEILYKVSEEELNKAIEWCNQKLRFKNALEDLVD